MRALAVLVVLVTACGAPAPAAATVLGGTVVPGRSEIPIGPLAAGLTQDEHDPAAARRALDQAGR